MIIKIVNENPAQTATADLRCSECTLRQQENKFLQPLPQAGMWPLLSSKWRSISSATPPETAEPKGRFLPIHPEKKVKGTKVGCSTTHLGELPEALVSTQKTSRGGLGLGR